MREGLREPAEGMPRGVCGGQRPSLGGETQPADTRLYITRWRLRRLASRYVFLQVCFCRILGKSVHRDDFRIFDIYKHRNRVSEGGFL